MEIAIFNQAKQLANIKSIADGLEKLSQMEVMRLYHQKYTGNRKDQNQCVINGFYLQRGLANAVDEGQENGTIASNGRPRKRSHAATFFEELGINKYQVERWRKALEIPEEMIIKYTQKMDDEGEEYTTIGILNFAEQIKREYTKQANKDSILEIEKAMPATDHENCRYKDDLTQIWLGDAGNLDFIEDNIIDLIITSPPYNIGQKNGNGRVLWRGVEYSNSNDKMPENEYQEWQIKVLDELWRVTRSGGSLFYNHKIRNRDNQGIHPFSWISRSKWTFRQQIIWDRGSTHNKEMSYFWPHDEIIFWLTKGTEGVYLSNEGARMSTIWRFKFQTKSDHPAPFPKILPARCIRAASKEGDLILDPFGGSMTTCRAARELKRRSIGVDISEDYVTTYSNQFYQGVLL